MAAYEKNNDRLLTPADVAALFNVDPKTVTRWATAGSIPSIRTPGGHRRFRRSEVQQLLEGDVRSGVRYLLWSNKHNAWWKPNELGYTTREDEAGRYGEFAAIRIVLKSALSCDRGQVTYMVAEPATYLTRRG